MGRHAHDYRPTLREAWQAALVRWEEMVSGPTAVYERGRRRVVRKAVVDEDGQAGFDAAVRAIEDAGAGGD